MRLESTPAHIKIRLVHDFANGGAPYLSQLFFVAVESRSREDKHQTPVSSWRDAMLTPQGKQILGSCGFRVLIGVGIFAAMAYFVRRVR